jgi:dienelactone hydrolase
MFLILHGAEDENYPLTTVDQVIQELRAAKVPFQLEVYSGTGHGFSTPKNKAEERANVRSPRLRGRSRSCSASEAVARSHGRQRNGPLGIVRPKSFTRN